MSNIRVRFAPSPTGWLHVGSLRTVLFDYLIAKTLNGKLILRIEDTDQKREVAGAAEGLINILDWLGIKFDEGPGSIRRTIPSTRDAHPNANKDVGDYGPYIQSQRVEFYKKHGEILLNQGAAYRCFCTEERLKKMRQEQIVKKQPPRYDRICRDLTDEEIKNKLAAGEKFVIRQKIPLDGEVIAHDELRGDIKFNNADLEDQILIKSDGLPTYQLAVVVDDQLMAISHVLRGDEWLPSFPKNILLYQAFGWPAPKFIHLPLTLNKSGGKLSKRQGDVAVEDYKNNGYLPEALLNFCVLLGWHPSASAKAPKGKTDEILSLDQMIEYFDYKDMGTSPAIFDAGKLDYFNGYYIRKMSVEKLTEQCIPFLVDGGMIDLLNSNFQFPISNFQTNPKSQIPNKFKNKITGEEISLDYIKKIIALEQERLKKLSEIGELTRFFFEDELNYDAKLLIWKNLEEKQIKKNLRIIYDLLEKIQTSDWLKENIEKDIIDYLKERELKVGEPASPKPSLGGYLWPMRAALTGREASPGPFAVAEVLGKEESLKRINLAAKKL